MTTETPQPVQNPKSKIHNQSIVFDAVTKRFPAAPRPAVDGVSLEVDAGNLVVLLGPSGCGKTTLLKMVNRLYDYDSGSIFVEGTEVRALAVTDLRRRIGYVIQSTGLFPHMTVAKNIATVPEMLGWSRARITSRTEELLEMVGLPPGEYRGRYPAQLSGGQQQRVGLARALAADPAIMLMDEPFAAIDNITRRRLQDELLRIQGQVRKTIVFVTHDVEEALRLADNIAVMQEGRVVQYDTPLRILSAPANDFVASLMGTDDALRRLSLLSVESAMSAPMSKGLAPSDTAVRPQSTLREALNLFLSCEAQALKVTNNNGELVGEIDIQSIRRAVQPGMAE